MSYYGAWGDFNSFRKVLKALLYSLMMLFFILLPMYLFPDVTQIVYMIFIIIGVGCSVNGGS